MYIYICIYICIYIYMYLSKYNFSQSIHPDFGITPKPLSTRTQRAVAPAVLCPRLKRRWAAQGWQS